MTEKIGDTRFGQIGGQDDTTTQGFGALGVARDASVLNQDPIEPSHGFGVLGIAGDRNDVGKVVRSLFQLEQDQIPADNALDLNQRLPDAGVCGISTHPQGDFAGVLGYKKTGERNGAIGFLAGKNPFVDQPVGVYGQSGNLGVLGITNKADGRGVYGGSVGGVAIGVTGESDSNIGVEGKTNSGDGVTGSTQSNAQSGVFGFNGGGSKGRAVTGLNRPTGNGMWGHTTVEGGSGVVGSVDPGLSEAAGVTGIGAVAGRFIGIVEVTGDVKLLGADCAEDFDIADVEFVEPGTVMIVGEEGTLHQSQQAYDTRVAGVISGAGDFKPGIILDKQHSQLNRMPIALLGKVYCKVDASYAPIEVGDLLTTAPTPGHAMKASDPLKAFGSVLGKALRHLANGRGLIPILIALR